MAVWTRGAAPGGPHSAAPGGPRGVAQGAHAVFPQGSTGCYPRGSMRCCPKGSTWCCPVGPCANSYGCSSPRACKHLLSESAACGAQMRMVDPLDSVEWTQFAALELEAVLTLHKLQSSMDHRSCWRIYASTSHTPSNKTMPATSTRVTSQHANSGCTNVVPRVIQPSTPARYRTLAQTETVAVLSDIDRPCLPCPSPDSTPTKGSFLWWR